MVFDGNILYVSQQNANNILKIDTSQSNPTITKFVWT